MTIQQLQYFCKTAELQHFTRAAEQLNVSQPSLSYAISNLEEELGAPLFLREGRNARLTECGRMFQTYAQRALETIAEAKSAVTREIRKNDGYISLAYVTSMGMAYLPKLINQYYLYNPREDIHFNLEQCHSVLHSEKLKHGGHDLAFGSYFEDADLVFREIFREEIVLAVPASHPLAQKAEVSFADFSHEKLVAFLKPAYIRQQIDQLFAEHGQAPNIVHEATNEIIIAGMIAAGHCVGLLPRAFGSGNPAIRMLPIRDCGLYRSLYIIWVRDKPVRPVVADFRDFVIQASREGNLFME